MQYITAKQAGVELKVTANWIRQLAAQGRIPGAKRFGNSWMLPRGVKIRKVKTDRPLRTTEIPKK